MISYSSVDAGMVATPPPPPSSRVLWRLPLNSKNILSLKNLCAPPEGTANKHLMSTFFSQIDRR